MTTQRVHIKSFGCQMNKLDTAMITAALKEAGFSLAEEAESAYVVLINTCSVRQHAEEKVLSILGRLKNMKESRPGLVVGVIGCMAQRLGSELLKNKAVDLVCGPAQIPQIVPLINQALARRDNSLAVTEKIRQQLSDSETHALEDFESVYNSDDKAIPNQAFVRVMRGCNNFCSYCVVPYVRGPEASRSPQAVIEQVKKLADEGVKLVTLLGQTVNSYKYAAGEKTYCLADLLEMTNAVNGIHWIRFVTNYPSEQFFDEILRAMAGLPKVCNYLHIPAQSGSDKILKAMNRRYTRDQYLALLEKARGIVPDIAVAGDFIVGFPDETDEDFEDTIRLVKKAEYKNCFVFKYSPRPQTLAQKELKDNISPQVKTQRNIELLEIQSRISKRLSRRFLDKEVEVLVEGPSKKPHLNKGQDSVHPQLVSRTADDYIVVFNGPVSLAGEFAKVKITMTSPLTLFGTLC